MKNKIISAILLIVLVAGIVVIALKGLNYELKYSDSKELDLYIAKQVSVKDVKQIVREVLGNIPLSVREIEEYGDAVAVIAKDISDEQKSEIINKVNEKYGTEIDSESAQIITLSHIQGRDIVKKYILPFTLSTVIILVYLIIRYYRLGIVKVLLKSIFAIVLTQVELLSVLAITRIPVGNTTTLLVLTVYMITLVALTTNYENKEKADK